MLELRGEPGRARVELSVGEALGAGDQRDGLGRLVDLRFDQFVNAALAREVELRVVPLREGLELAAGEQGDATEFLRGVGHHFAEDRAHVIEEAEDGGAVEEIDRVVDAADHALAGLLHPEGEIGLRGRRVHVDLAVRHVPQ